MYYYSKEVGNKSETKHDKQSDFSKLTSSSRSTTEERLLEKDLYPMVVEYLYLTQKVFSRYIPVSPNAGEIKGANHWLFPDIIGAQDLTRDWTDNVKDCISKINYPRLKLWSLEVKQEINVSNLRECFFQVVANSSWANFAYLVTAKFQKSKAEIIKRELRVLCNSYSIGCIEFDTNDIYASKIIIQARERNISWAMANRLAENCDSFKECINHITKFYGHGYGAKLEGHNWGIIENKDEEGVISINEGFLPPSTNENN